MEEAGHPRDFGVLDATSLNRRVDPVVDTELVLLIAWILRLRIQDRVTGQSLSTAFQKVPSS